MPPSTRRQLLLSGVACVAGAAGAGWGASAAHAQSPTLPRGTEAEARAAVVELLRSVVSDVERPLTGISVAWLHGDNRVSRAWAGWRHIGADHPEGSLAIDGQTLFRIASVSKLALALAMLRLHDARLMDLDDDLSGLLRLAFRHPGFPQTPITPRLLLSHRSGLLDAATLPFADGAALRHTLAQPGSWGAEEPGRMFRYSNLGSVVLATAMEAAARQTFADLMQRWLFDPLGMSCRYRPAALTPPQRAQLATLYRRPDRSPGWVPQFDQRADVLGTQPEPAGLQLIGDNASLHSPQGGLRCSVTDLSRLTRLLMQEGRWEGRRLLSTDSWAQLLRPHWQLAPDAPGETAGGLFRSWGLGLQRFTDTFDARGGDRLVPRGGVMAYGHLGSAYGLLSGLLFHPPQGRRPAWGLVYVINGSSQGAAESPGQYSSLRRSEERVVESLLDILAPTREPT
ncbi:MAG: serine hydrolase [Rubrivivax sp.]|nr:serine hydrolase [Rubrivivax sp.]